MKKILILLMLMAGVVQGQPTYEIFNYTLPSITGATVIGIPREQIVCLSADSALVMRWGYGTDYFFKTTNRGATWMDTLTGYETGRHNHLQVYNDTLYVYNQYYPDTEDRWSLQIINTTDMTQVTRVYKDTTGYGGADLGLIPSGIHWGTTGNMVTVLRDGADCACYYRSTDWGRTWNSQAGDVTNCDGGRMGMFPVGDSGAVVVYDNSIEVYHYGWTANTWTEELSGGAHLVHSDSTSGRCFNAVELNDTLYIGYSVDGYVGYNVAKKEIGAGVVSTTRLYTGSSYYISSPEFIGYIGLTTIKNIDAIGVFYVKPDGVTSWANLHLYFQLYYGGTWYPEQLVLDSSACGNLTVPFIVPASHGNYAYCQISRVNSSGASQLVVVKINGISEESPTCAIDYTSHDFGNVVVDDSLDWSFTIENTGGGTLSGTPSEASSDYSIVSGGTAYALTYSQTRTVTVRFKPTGTGTKNVTIETGNALCSDVSLTGVGISTAEAPGNIIIGYLLDNNWRIR